MYLFLREEKRKRKEKKIQLEVGNIEGTNAFMKSPDCQHVPAALNFAALSSGECTHSGKHSVIRDLSLQQVSVLKGGKQGTKTKQVKL